MHISLLFHGLARNSNDAASAPRPELMIPINEVRKLIESMLENGWTFGLPSRDATTKSRSCSITFDDGYFNNHLFQSVAHEHKIPFILFANSFNIACQVPFAWDIQTKIPAFDITSVYTNKSPRVCADLMSRDSVRPFRKDELRDFLSTGTAYLGLHTHKHHPLTLMTNAQIEDDLALNRKFVSRFPAALPDDLALPCGLYDKRVMTLLSRIVTRVYTTNNGPTTPGSSIIHRIPLVNPANYLPLPEQVARHMKTVSRWRRQARMLQLRLRLSNFPNSVIL